MKKINALLLLLFTCLLLANCSKKTSEDPQPIVPHPVDTLPKPDTLRPDTVKYGSLQMVFSHKAGTESFSFNKEYINSSGETFKVNTLRYILSNFKLKKPNGTELKLPGTYFIMDPSVGTTFTIKNVPEGLYTDISYLIGVDSITTAGGAKTGALDPVNGMYWSWQTGYINFRMIGTSPSASPSTKVFDYDVGGFLAPNQTVQSVAHSFRADTLNIRSETKPMVTVNVDILEFFKNPEDFSIAKVSVISSPGINAVKAANNYKDMFSFQSISH